ncbi:hypothetical protein AB0C42_03015 [Micromonospora taraxaci]|uniref:Flavin reductase n=1 Tax=Micromonospora taraxaci TaxID=1316803 RepID=A0A561VEE5_9ACTN|nr:hypothetical protein [Micromonospora taraxaci]TWG09980.1 hypothetical protein FHU34_12432 [Micromonospora taraxaci]
MTDGAERSGVRVDDHAPKTPCWSCGSCGDEWPCATKRSRLLAEYGGDRAMLSVYLGSCLAAATEDLRAAPVMSLQDRFIGWLPRGSRRA